jgi:hypothetical protein
MKVFISHSLPGTFLARAIASGLRNEGLQVWLAENEILPGDNWAERVSQALKECDAMVALLTPDTLQTGNVQWEMSFAMGAKAYRHRLIPVLVGTEMEMPARSLPWILERFRVVRLAEPDKAGEAVREVAEALMTAA